MYSSLHESLKKDCWRGVAVFRAATEAQSWHEISTIHCDSVVSTSCGLFVQQVQLPYGGPRCSPGVGAQGKRITISWRERERKTEKRIVTLTDEEYKRKLKRNNEAALEYGKNLYAKRDALAKEMISKMRVSEGFLDHPDLKNTREWMQTRYFVVYSDYPCKETDKIVCVTQEKIAGRIPKKSEQVIRSFWVDTKKELTFWQRDCTLEEETNQFVCWHHPSSIALNAQNKEEAEKIKVSIIYKKRYKYFRY